MFGLHTVKLLLEIHCIDSDPTSIHLQLNDIAVNYIITSAVPVERETLKSERDRTGRDDGLQRRWKDRREG